MTQTQTQTPAADDKAAKKMTAAEAAKRVKRTIIEQVKVGTDADGKDVFKAKERKVDVAASEVLDFKDYGTHVVVVTKDGQKFTDKAED